jgi:Protein of unknown function (DUF935)
MIQYITKLKNSLKTLSLKSVLDYGKLMPNRNDKQSIIVNKVDVRPIQRKSQDIQTWRNALVMAEGIYQQRAQLYTLYDEVLIDGFLNAVIEKRIMRVTNAKITFKQKNKENEDVAKLMRTTAFETFLRETMNSKFFGHSLLEMAWSAPSEASSNSTILIDRRHVKPRYEIVTRNAHDIVGYKYTEKPYKAVMIEVGNSENLGLLLKVCPYVLLKRGGIADWAEFAEVFGMPLRWATYRNEASREILSAAMAEAGSAGYVVAPEDANIQFLSSSGTTGNDVFSKLREAMNEEISIAILGNTMTTTEAKNSGYAQSQTHSNEQDELHADDKAFVLRILNEKLIPYLASIGYAIEGGEFSYVEEERMSKKEKLEIAEAVSKYVAIGKSYWYETFGIPMPKKNDLPDNVNNPEGDTMTKGGAAKKAKRAQSSQIE